MGKKSSPSPPPAPDPVATAQAQGAMDKETAIAQAALNRINENTPYGSLTYTKGAVDPETGIPSYTRNVSLTPAQQRALQSEQQMTENLYGLAADQYGRVDQAISQPFSFGGQTPIPGQQDMLAERKRVEDSMFKSQMDRLDPRFQEEQKQLETQLANQGFTMGGEAIDNEMGKLGERQSDATNQALAQAIQFGGAEQSRNLQNALQARQQGITEQSYLRNLPLNEAIALMGGGQIQGPQVSGVAQGQLNTPDLAGMTYSNYQGALQNYQNQLSKQGGMMGSLGGLVGTLGAAGISKWG